MPKQMISVAEALERVFKAFSPLSREEIPLEYGLGRYLAVDIVAGINLPPFSNSAMDGYAILGKDIEQFDPNAPPVLKVIGDIAAGSNAINQVSRGEAVRIMTGAPMPSGADTVIPVENTDQPGALTGKALQSQIQILIPVKPGAHVRLAGLDVRKSDLVLSAGTRLEPPQIAMLAALGVARPAVYRKPQVAIFSSGDELVEIDQPLAPGSIHDSNGYALAAAVERAGGTAIRLGAAPDTAEDVAALLERGIAENADLIISSAGVSVGAYDFVSSVLKDRGKLEFWKVNLRPGKPFMFGSVEGIPFVGLPGNPVSAMVTFEIFVKPAIDRMCGAEAPRRLVVSARMKHAVKSDGRESYLRGIVTTEDDGFYAELTGTQDSSAISSLIVAN
jgi:molybdopterin molybdotransferase